MVENAIIPKRRRKAPFLLGKLPTRRRPLPAYSAPMTSDNRQGLRRQLRQRRREIPAAARIAAAANQISEDEN